MKKLSELSIEELLLVNMLYSGIANSGLRLEDKLIKERDKIIDELLKRRKELGEIDFNL